MFFVVLLENLSLKIIINNLSHREYLFEDGKRWQSYMNGKKGVFRGRGSYKENYIHHLYHKKLWKIIEIFFLHLLLLVFFLTINVKKIQYKFLNVFCIETYKLNFHSMCNMHHDNSKTIYMCCSMFLLLLHQKNCLAY